MVFKTVLKNISHLLPDRMYISLKYKLRFGKWPDLKNPTTYNEKLQWLKLYDRKPEYTMMVDKYEVKKYITNEIGEQYVIPTLGVWDRFDDIDFDSLPSQFVLKCTHDSGGLVICRDKSTIDIPAARKKINNSLKQNYYWQGREWPYKNVKPRIIAEEYFVNDDVVQKKHGLFDYKFMCFSGKVKALFLDIGVIGQCNDHSEEYYRNVYDESGTILPLKETREHYPNTIELPSNYMEMVEIAEKLSQKHPHIRVDLYNINGNIKVGELTFFHGSGFTNTFIPDKWNDIFGSWIDLPKNIV